MGYANINALYAGSLRIKISYFFAEQFTSYKWCVTKVAHCIVKLIWNVQTGSLTCMQMELL